VSHEQILTPRERFVAALEHRPIVGRVPHFELVFYLTMEAFAKVHPSHRYYSQWDQMSEEERQLHRSEMADIYLLTAERYEHDAIFLHPNPDTLDETMRLIDLVRARSGARYFLMMHGDATYSIPNGETMEEWSAWLFEHPEEVHAKADRMVDKMLEKALRLREHGGLDGFALCADYCFNYGPFLRPSMFRQVVTPYLVSGAKGRKCWCRKLPAGVLHQSFEPLVHP
jgi:uroporphyrinogen decarboxylase